MKKLGIILLFVLSLGGILAGCSNNGGEVLAKKGDIVRVDYTGSLADGTVFDSSKGREPLEFTVGSGQVITGFDSAVIGMKIGQTKTVNIPFAQAYGPRDENSVFEVKRTQLPPTITPVVGAQLQIRNPDGSSTTVTVTKVTDASITVDANPPLAGKDLTFIITLVEIKK